MGGELQTQTSPVNINEKEQQRNRADSYAFTFGVTNPIPELVKKE